jgi:hypothetical protein
VQNGALTADNACNLGEQFGAAFSGHPALGYWVMGGDNWRAVEDVEIWRELMSGLRAAGASEPATYHTPPFPGESGHERFADEAWVDFLSPQTGHCIAETECGEQLSALVETAGKPVWAAEMRYEGITPDWCAPEFDLPVDARAVEADAQAAVAAGCSGLVFGHNERWQWGLDYFGGSGGGASAALASLGSEGERLTLQAAKAGCLGLSE